VPSSEGAKSWRTSRPEASKRVGARLSTSTPAASPATSPMTPRRSVEGSTYDWASRKYSSLTSGSVATTSASLSSGTPGSGARRHSPPPSAGGVSTSSRVFTSDSVLSTRWWRVQVKPLSEVCSSGAKSTVSVRSPAM
jgi:hypothetical protein